LLCRMECTRLATAFDRKDVHNVIRLKRCFYALEVVNTPAIDQNDDGAAELISFEQTVSKGGVLFAQGVQQGADVSVRIGPPFLLDTRERPDIAEVLNCHLLRSWNPPPCSSQLQFAQLLGRRHALIV